MAMRWRFWRSPTAAADITSRIRALEESELPDYGYRYLEHVLAEYMTSPLPDSSPPGRIAEIAAAYRARRPVTWGDLYVLEKHVLKGQPFQTLRRRASGLRANFREIIGPRAYEGYLSSRPPNENEPDVEEGVLRADLERLLGSLHWYYTLMPIRESIRSRILEVSGWWMAAALGVLLLLTWWTRWYDGKPLVATLLLVSFAGALGGFISLQRRIQTIPTDGDPLVSIFELVNGKFTLYLAPVSGAVFALFLYFAFLGELLAGGVFPEIHVAGKPASVPFRGYLFWDKEFAKLLIWSFIAGFAERFVPDTIGRLVERSRETAAPTSAPQPTPPYPQSSPPANPGASRGVAGGGTATRPIAGGGPLAGWAPPQRATVDWRQDPRAASPPWR